MPHATHIAAWGYESPEKKIHNKALHWTAIPLRSIAAGELGRYAAS